MKWPKKVVAVCGSPRSGMGDNKSLTERVLNLFLEGLSPVECRIFYPHKMKIAYCQGCYTCWFKTPGECYYDDDMGEISKGIKEADLIILASPVYVDGFSAQTKTVLDRCIAMMDPLIITDEQGHCRHQVMLPEGKMAMLISACGFSELDNFDHIRRHFAAICRNFFWQQAGELLVPASALGFVSGVYSQKFAAVKRAGEEFGMNGSISPATLQEISAEIMEPAKYQEIVNPFFERLRRLGGN
jgi:multimeric flavodoxin WrbA